MRRSQAGILAFLVLAAACVLMFALLPGAPREPAVGAVQELERLRSGRWPREPVPAGATIELKSPR